jgi:CheY-like chemotaxis protein
MNRNVPILLVEDDDVDVENVERAFEENGISNPLHVARNGLEALRLLRSNGAGEPCGQGPRPGLILLDINMPIMNGFEFLAEIKRDPALRSIPVVVLTTSQEESDRHLSFQHSVAGYIIKPVEFMDFVGVVQTIDRYWSLSEIGAEGSRL